MTSSAHNQVKAAQVQLDRAIALFLDDKDCYSAATLAGASEEIFGKLAERSGRGHALGSTSSAIERTLSEEEKQAIGKNGVITVLNGYRNWLKHYDEENETLYIDAEFATFELIERAVENCFSITGNVTLEMERFRIYSSERNA
jgi:hypothetical protein